MSLNLCDETLGHNNKEGYLMKRNRKGYFNNRYFRTSNEIISYWIEKASFDKSHEPSSTFEIKDIKTIERSSNGRMFSLVFGDKFRIDLKCDLDVCSAWYEILTAKKSFYSVKALLTDLQNDRTQFVTKTFSSLMIIPVKEQNDWIIDHLNDTYEAAANEAQTSMLRSNPMWVIKASRVVVEEFISTCDECSLEMESRNPKLTAHCRGYMHRYAEIIKGRLALELSFFMGTGNKQIMEMGERALCAAISLMDRLDSLRTYSFLPHELVNSLISCLFSVGELMSALLNLSIDRIESWFCTVLAMSPDVRGSRLVEVNQVLINALKMIDFHAHEEYDMYRDLLIKVAMSLQLNFSDQLLLLDLREYDEAALLSHVKACHTIVDQLPSHFDIIRSKDGDEKDPDRQGTSDSDSEFSLRIELSGAATDSVRCACLSSARTAVVQAVQRVGLSVQGLLDLFFVENQKTGWIGGEVCRAYLDRLEGWLRDLLDSVPLQYTDLTTKEAARTVARLFFKALIKFYQENKHSKFSDKGRAQVLDDMRALSVWLMELFHNVSDVIDEQQLLLFLDGFISCPQGEMLQLYALSLQTFGIHYSLELYDLLRLSLKIRSDCSTKARKGMLALCAEFYVQLQVVVASDSTVLGGRRKRAAFTSVFCELCPKVSIEHCTGKKWSFERMSDPVAVRILVARFVTETCQAARLRERALANEEETSRKEGEASTPPLQLSPRNPPPPPIAVGEERKTHYQAPLKPSKGPAKPPRLSYPSSSSPTILYAPVPYYQSAVTKQEPERQLQLPSLNPFGDDDDEDGEHQSGINADKAAEVDNVTVDHQEGEEGSEEGTDGTKLECIVGEALGIQSEKEEGGEKEDDEGGMLVSHRMDNVDAAVRSLESLLVEHNDVEEYDDDFEYDEDADKDGKATGECP